MKTTPNTKVRPRDTQSKARAKRIDEAIRFTWSSLESHLQYTHEKHHDSAAFHKKCVKEYANTIKLLSDLY